MQFDFLLQVEAVDQTSSLVRFVGHQSFALLHFYTSLLNDLECEKLVFVPSLHFLCMQDSATLKHALQYEHHGFDLGVVGWGHLSLLPCFLSQGQQRLVVAVASNIFEAHQYPSRQTVPFQSVPCCMH